MLRKVLSVSIIVVCCIIAWNIWSNKDNSAELAVESKVNQMVMTEELNDNLDMTNINLFIDSVSTNTEIIVFKENGTANISYNSYDAKWNKWLTNNEIKLQVNYLSVVSIPTESINLNLVGQVLYVSFPNSAFNVTALEITDKYINEDRSVFGHRFTDDEKISLENMLKNEIKSKMLNKKSLQECEESLKYYLSTLADELNVDIVFE